MSDAKRKKTADRIEIQRYRIFIPIPKKLNLKLKKAKLEFFSEILIGIKKKTAFVISLTKIL